MNEMRERFDKEFGDRNLRDDISQQKVAQYIKRFIERECAHAAEAMRQRCEGAVSEQRILQGKRGTPEYTRTYVLDIHNSTIDAALKALSALTPISTNEEPPHEE